MPPADSDSEDDRLRTDEYGDRFEDYGFCKRAEEHKRSGNDLFQRGRFERALKEYDGALDQLLTVAYDKSIIVGQRKWADVVVLRSTLHLNKSACHFKLQAWQDAAREALECLHGNIRETLLYSDPQVRAKVREAENRCGGAAGGAGRAGVVEDKLPRELRAKAWFRLSKSYANLDFLDKAQDALTRACKVCDGEEMLAELKQHATRVQALERRQEQRQKVIYRGFFEKLQDRGGYIDVQDEVKAKWHSLSYDEKLRRLEELDDSDGEDLCLAGRPAPGELASRAAAQRRTAEAPPSAVGAASARVANLTFEEYLERQDGGSLTDGKEVLATLEPAPPPSNSPLSPPAASAATDVAGVVAQRRQEEFARRDQAWKERQQARELDDLEEEELRKARERLASSRSGAARARRRRSAEAEAGGGAAAVPAL